MKLIDLPKRKWLGKSVKLRTSFIDAFPEWSVRQGETGIISEVRPTYVKIVWFDGDEPVEFREGAVWLDVVDEI